MGMLSIEVAAEPSTISWETARSDHFMIYFREASPEYLDQLMAKAEAYYQQVTAQLGFTRFDRFWTWDERAEIYLYRDRDEYQRVTNQPAWSEAGANVLDREIHTYVNMEDFFETVLPHELGHIIFREFIGYHRVLPLWLDEGIACFLEERRQPTRLMRAKALVHTDQFLSLQVLTQSDPGRLPDPEAFYAEAASLIEFLFHEYGQERFVEYCRRLRDQQDWEDALTTVYGFRSLAEMNEQWVEFLKS